MSAERTDLSTKTRDQLLAAHRTARERRERAALGSEAYAAAAQEVARIEVALNRLSEPAGVEADAAVKAATA